MCLAVIKSKLCITDINCTKMSLHSGTLHTYRRICTTIDLLFSIMRNLICQRLNSLPLRGRQNHRTKQMTMAAWRNQLPCHVDEVVHVIWPE